MGPYQKFFVENFFMVAKSFPRKQDPSKNFHQQFFMVAKSFPRKQVPTKNFRYKFFGRKMFMVSK